jgi:hypothetical protein
MNIGWTIPPPLWDNTRPEKRTAKSRFVWAEFTQEGRAVPGCLVARRRLATLILHAALDHWDVLVAALETSRSFSQPMRSPLPQEGVDPFLGVVK